MKGSSGVNNKNYIKASRFNEIFKRYIHDFYVNKYMKPTDFLDKYGIPVSSFSETRKKVMNGLSKEEQRLKKGEPVSISEITENQSCANPFYQLYDKCIDNDSLYFLHFMTVFYVVETLQKFIDSCMDNLETNKYWTKKSIVESLKENDEISKQICRRFHCNLDCSKSGKCLIARAIKICGGYGVSGGLTLRELCDIDIGHFSRDLAFTDVNTVRSKLVRLAEYGYLKYDGTRFYKVHNEIPDVDKDRLYALLLFCAENRPFGEVGYSVINKLGLNSKIVPFRYKHRFVFNAVNDYTLIDLLYAIEQEIHIKLKYNDEILYVYPIQVRQSTSDGRQYLVCYFPDRKSVSSLIVDYISDVETVELTKDTDEICNAKKLLNYCWNSGFDGFEYENCGTEEFYLCKAVIDFAISEDKQYLLDKINREVRLDNFTVSRIDDETVRVEGLVSCADDMKPWVNSFIQCVKHFECQPIREFGESKLYEIKANKRKMDFPSTKYLFCQETGKQYREVCKLFVKTLNGSASDDEISTILNSLVEHDNKTGEVVQKDYYDDLCTFFTDLKSFISESDFAPYLKDSYSDILLSDLEKNWINNCFNDRYAYLFLDSGISFEVYNLLPVNYLVYCDQAVNNIKVSADIFRTILSSIYDSKKVKLVYSKGDKVSSANDGIYSIESVYYSLHEDTFCVNAVGDDEYSTRIFRLDRIVSVEILNESVDRKYITDKVDEMIDYSEKQIIKIGLFDDNHDVVDRFFREISSYSFECRKYETKEIIKQKSEYPVFVDWDENVFNYCVEIRYPGNDYNEIVNRILSYGGDIYILIDDYSIKDFTDIERKKKHSAAAELYRRIELQKKC